MFEKALWFQNYKQAKMVIWMMLALFILQMPIQAILSIESWKERAAQADQAEEYVYEIQAWDILQIFSEGMFTIFVTVAIVMLAVLLIGLERNTRRNDFTFSLPFKRETLFLAKWALGTVIITVFFIINFVPAYFIVQQSDFNSGLNLVTSLEIFWGPLIGYIFFYTFALLIGTITGEMISQIFLTFILGFLPQMILILIQEFMRVHDFFLFSIGSQPRWVEYITPVYYAIGEMGEIIGILAAIVFTSLSLWGGSLLYRNNKIEHNGEFLVFKSLNPIFMVLLTVLISLFGGLLLSSLAPWGANVLRILSYWIGFTTFLLFALLFIRRLAAMNVTFTGKPT
jgi:ABC-type transport system involved in multi-copper enzyme maturation permease subunit